MKNCCSELAMVGSQDQRLATAAPILVIALAACGAPAPVDPTPNPPAGGIDSQNVQLNVPTGLAAVTQARLVLWDPAESEVPTTGTLEMMREALYGGPPASFTASGNATVLMPNGADIPSSLLAEPALFMSGAEGVPFTYHIDSTCDMQVSDATATLLDVDVEQDIDAMATWVYSDKNVTIATPPGGCSGAGSAAYLVDVSLTKGWNAAGFTFERVGDDLSEIRLKNADFDDVFVNVFGDIEE